MKECCGFCCSGLRGCLASEMGKLVCRWLFASVKNINKTRGCDASFLVAFDPMRFRAEGLRASAASEVALELIFRVNRGGGVWLTNLPQILRNKKK